MRRGMASIGVSARFALGAAILMAAHARGFADELCHGHRLFPTPRPAESCHEIVPEVYASPDGELRAFVFPAGVSLYATPDIESRVVIRSITGDTRTSIDYSSPRGANGYYVYEAKWSPDSLFFVFSMVSSGGHSPWSFPTMVYSRENNLIANISDMIGDRPILSGDFLISAPHSLTVSTWKQPGELDNPISVTVDLKEAFAKLAASGN